MGKSNLLKAYLLLSIFFVQKNESILTRWAKPTYSVVVDVVAKLDSTSAELKNNSGILGLECPYPSLSLCDLGQVTSPL